MDAKRLLYGSLCATQDTSQALQALASMPKDTLLQKMQAQGELSHASVVALYQLSYLYESSSLLSLR